MSRFCVTEFYGCKTGQFQSVEKKYFIILFPIFTFNLFYKLNSKYILIYLFRQE